MISATGSIGPTGPELNITEYVYASAMITTNAVNSNTPISGWIVQELSGGWIVPRSTTTGFLLAPNHTYLVYYTANLRNPASNQIIELGLAINGNIIQSTTLAGYAQGTNPLSVYPISGTAIIESTGAGQTLSVNLPLQSNEAVSIYNPGVSAQLVILGMK